MIKKLPSGTWEYRGDTYDPATGRRRQIRRRFPSKGAAQAFERSIIVSGSAAPARDVPPFASYSEAWVESRRALGNVSPSTIASYKSRLRVLKPILGDVPVSRLTPSRIEGAVAQLLKTISPRTAKVYITVIRMVCTRAVRDGYLQSDPVARMEPIRFKAQEYLPPDADALTGILRASQGSPSHLPLLIMAMTGMRISEVLGLQWDCVDLRSRSVTVRRQRCILSKYPDLPLVPGTSTVVVEHTKTRQVRTVAIPDVLVTALREARRGQLASGHPSQFVCTDASGIPISRERVAHAVPKGIRLHDIRHAHATILIDAGVPITEISRRLGHSSAVTTAGIYAHALAAQNRAASDAISIALDTKVDTRDTPLPTTTRP